MAKILVVDDSRFERSLISRLLVNNEHEVVEADSGANAVKNYRSVKPDMVLMDIQMAGMNGILSLIEIRKFHAEACVIMLTTVGEESKVREAIKFGAVDYVLKPFNRERVLAAVEKASEVIA